jgi:hypothetical protein
MVSTSLMVDTITVPPRPILLCAPNCALTMQILLRLGDDVVEELDDWRRQQKDLPSRPQAIYRLLAQQLSQAKKQTENGR